MLTQLRNAALAATELFPRRERQQRACEVYLLRAEAAAAGRTRVRLRCVICACSCRYGGSASQWCGRARGACSALDYSPCRGLSAGLPCPAPTWARSGANPKLHGLRANPLAPTSHGLRAKTYTAHGAAGHNCERRGERRNGPANITPHATVSRAVTAAAAHACRVMNSRSALLNVNAYAVSVE